MERGVRIFHFISSVFLCCGRYQERITNQLTRLGGSYDWDRVAFTMDGVRFLIL
jgi:valyl-tRNA synthetase